MLCLSKLPTTGLRAHRQHGQHARAGSVPCQVSLQLSQARQPMHLTHVCAAAQQILCLHFRHFAVVVSSKRCMDTLAVWTLWLLENCPTCHFFTSANCHSHRWGHMVDTRSMHALVATPFKSAYNHHSYHCALLSRGFSSLSACSCWAACCLSTNALAVPALANCQQGWGRIVNTGSMHALVASPFKSAYNAAKHGIAGFTKTVALEMAQKNITCNAICPGYVLTGGAGDAFVPCCDVLCSRCYALAALLAAACFAGFWVFTVLCTCSAASRPPQHLCFQAVCSIVRVLKRRWHCIWLRRTSRVTRSALATC
jgi:hypothetical protein